MKTTRFRITRSGVVLAASILVLVAAIAVRLAGIQMQTVTSGSMEPSIRAGDIALTQPAGIATLQVGDVIAFFPPGETQARLHRITSITPSDGLLTVTTKGDANRVEDPWHAQLHGPTAYRLVGVLPFVGWIAPYRGFFLIAAGLLMAAALAIGYRKERKARRPSPAT